MYFRIEADDHAFDKVMDEALSCGLGVFPGKVLYSDTPERWQSWQGKKERRGSSPVAGLVLIIGWEGWPWVRIEQSIRRRRISSL